MYDGEMPKHNRISKENVNTGENIANVEPDNPLDLNRNTKDTNSNAEIIKMSLIHEPNPVPHINDSTFKKINQVNKTTTENCEPVALNGLTTMTMLSHDNAISNIETGCEEPIPIKRTLNEILFTEVCLLEYTHKVRVALKINHADCKTAIKGLEEINELEFINSFMLIKHKEVLDTIKRVTKYVGNVSEWNLLNVPETIKCIKETEQIRCKAGVIFDKFVALFNVPDEKSFQEVFDKRLQDFNTVTKNMNPEHIYKLTSTKYEILLTEVHLLDCVQKLRLFLNSNHADCEPTLKVLEEINELKSIKTFMLTKHKEVVITIKQMSVYTGNPNKMNFEKQEIIKHDEKTEQIRCKADALFNKFVAMFNVPEGKQFDEVFNNAVEDYNFHHRSKSKSHKKIAKNKKTKGKKK